MNVKVTFEFPSIEHAISWLGTKVMAGAPVAKLSLSSVANQGVIPAGATPAENAPAARTRKPRNDAGKRRGSYKNTAAPDAITTSAASPAPVAPVAAVPIAAVAAPIPAEGDKPQPSGTLSGAAAPSATQEEVQALFEKVFNQKGMKTGRDLLSRYGIKRMPELPKEMYGEFAQHAKTVLEGGEV
jgi:hypothetical protein